MLTMVNIIGFAEWLQGELDKRGWKASDLARRGGTAPSQLSRILNKERGVGPEACREIARGLKLPPETVFRQAGLLPPDVDGDAPARRELLHLFEQLPAGDRGLVLSMVRAVVCERAPKYNDEEVPHG